MRELTLTEMESVDGGFGLLAVAGGIGLAVSIPTIVLGAVTGVPTLGLGFVAMAAGIVGTALSGAAIVTSVVL